MKKYIRNLHLWIGLATGLVFFLVSLSGALLSFTEEALLIVNKEYLYVPEQNRPRAKVEEVIANYEKAYPKEHVFLINTYTQANRTYDFFSAVKSGKKDADGNDIFEGYKMVYANPYTSEIIRVDKGTLETIVILVQLHVNLLAGSTGNYIIKIATVIFLIELIAGLYLWWPRTSNARRTAFKIKRSGNRKRFQYDLHRTLGFYTSVVLLVLTVTGLIMAWPFLKGPLVNVLGGKAELLAQEAPPQPPRQSGKPDYSCNGIFNRLRIERPDARQITFFVPESDTVTVINGTTGVRPSFLNFETGTYFQFNRYTGEPTGGEDLQYYLRNAEISAGLLLIHMGFWGGITTKVLTFICGMIGASLPITGFLIWRGRRKQKQNPKIAS
jgi:uncharacterized iron-regulated membrane protein